MLEQAYLHDIQWDANNVVVTIGNRTRMLTC